MPRQPQLVAPAFFALLSLTALSGTASGSEYDFPLPRTAMEELAPVDITLFDGNFYATFPSKGRLEIIEAAGVLSDESGQSTDEGRSVAERLHRPWGVARLADEGICVSHYTSDDPLRRLSSVSCLRGDSWQPLIEGVGQGINGIASAGDGIWLAAWRDTEVESRDGFLAYFEAGQIQEVVELPSQVPQFVSVKPGGGLLVTTWLEDASGYTSGRILEVDSNGSVRELKTGLALPAGVAVGAEVTWVADHLHGSLVAIDSNGMEVDRLEGLSGPLGVEMESQDEICVAEALAVRVTCRESPGRSAPE